MLNGCKAHLLHGRRKPRRLIPVAARSLSPEERFEYLEWVFMESSWKDNLGLVTVDGIADLVNNTNDLDQANKVVNALEMDRKK